MIINHPQYGEVFVSSDGMMYVYDEERGNVPVGKYNNGEPDVSLFQSPTQSIGQRYYDGERWVSMDDQESVVMEGITNKVRPLGYVPYSGWTGDQMNWNHYSGAGGNQFASEMDYLNWLYGPGGTVETLYDNQEPQQFYKAPNGADTYLPGRTPLSYDAPDSLGGQLVLAGLGGLAGGAFLGPALSGLAGTTSGTLAGSMVTGAASGIGAGGLTSAVNGGNILEGALKGGLLGAAGGGIMQATGLSDYLSSLGGGDVQATGLSDLADLDQVIGGFESSGVNPGGLDGAMADSAANYIAAMGDAGVSALGSGASQAFDFKDYLKTGSINGNAANPTPTLPGVGNGVGLTEAAMALGTPAASTVAGRIFDGDASSSDWLSALGTVGATGLGLAGANAQGDAFKDVYNQQMSLGAPYRDKLAQSYQPGFSMADQPDFMNALNIGADAAARATSAKVGNPVGNPGAYAEMQKYISGSLALPQLNTYRSQLGSFGQLGTNTAGTAALGQAQSNGGTYNALGYGLGQLTQPDNPFKGLLSQFGKNNGFSF